MNRHSWIAAYVRKEQEFSVAAAPCEEGNEAFGPAYLPVRGWSDSEKVRELPPPSGDMFFRANADSGSGLSLDKGNMLLILSVEMMQLSNAVHIDRSSIDPRSITGPIPNRSTAACTSKTGRSMA